MIRMLVLLGSLLLGGGAGVALAALLAPPDDVSATADNGTPRGRTGASARVEDGVPSPVAPGGGPSTEGANAGSAGAEEHADQASDHGETRDKAGDPTGARSFIAVGRQLIIPVVKGETTRALILFELAVDVPSELTEVTHTMLPRLRDAFLRELFAMSYTGAFDDTYTDARIIEEMRRNLRVAARRILGDGVAEVLVLDVMRQEL